MYASLLLHYAKKPITEDALRRVLEAAGMEVDEVRLKAIVAALSGVNIDEAIKSASFAVPAPAVAQPVAQATAPAAGPAEQQPAKEEKREEKKEAAEEEIAEGLAALFG